MVLCCSVSRRENILLPSPDCAAVSRGEFGVLGPDDDCWSQMTGRIPSPDEV
ncbi:putative isoamylase [Helianthus anomalus]